MLRRFSRLSQGPFSILLSGDAEEEVEAEVLSHPEVLPFLKADLMKAGHHGSRTSNTEAFFACRGPASVWLFRLELGIPTGILIQKL
jgi:competence protein ComEC